VQKIRSVRTFWAISLFLLVMAAVLCALSFVLAEAQSQREMEIRAKEVNSQNLDQALFLAQNLNRAFAQADTILQFLQLELGSGGELDQAKAGLLRNFSRDELINQVAVANAEGKLIFAAISQNAPANIADREQFLFHRQIDSGQVYIARPVITQVTGTRSIFLTRRLNDAQRQFAGIVSVAIAPDYFAKMISQLQPQPHSSFVLLKPNGTFLARFPAIDSPAMMDSFRYHPVVAMLQQNLNSGVFESPGKGDGIARIGAFWKLSDYPAVVLVGYAKQEMFRAVYVRQQSYRVWAGVFSIVVGCLFLALWWQVRKQYEIEKELRDSENRLNQAQAIANVGNWEIELDSKQVWGSAEAFRIYGIERVAPYFSLSEIQQVVSKQDRNRMDSALQELLTSNGTYDVEYRINRIDNGLQRWVHSVARLERDGRGKPVKIIGVLQDVTERKQAEAVTHRSVDVQNVLREITEAAILAVSVDELYRMVHRLVGRVLPASLFHINLLDEASNEIVVPYRADEVNFIPERRPVGKGMTEYVMRQGKAVHVTPAEMERLRETGEYALGRVQIRHYLGAPLIDSQGKPFGTMALILMGEDQPIQPEDVELLSIIASQVSMVIERKRAIDRLRESEEKFRYMTENSSDVIWHLDQDFRFDYVSPANERLTGYRLDEVIGTTLWSHLKPEGIEHVKQRHAERLIAEQNGQKTGTTRYELEITCKDGSWVWAEISAEPHYDTNGKLVGLHGVTRDITERKRLEQELQVQATTDGLTGIFNRSHFWMRADEELRRIERYGGDCSLLMVDIDHFKQVNDTYGHAAGDAVLRWITRLCREAIRDTDLFGRVGGEEFAIMLLETDAAGAVAVAERLRQSICDTQFIHNDGTRIPLRVSVGVTQYQTNKESLSELMNRADKALYRAKNEGRNKVVEA
jgi:diguanylate cyclase (GGDEF)-like protein/PAS domain S-box-containing protein